MKTLNGCFYNQLYTASDFHVLTWLFLHTSWLKSGVKTKIHLLLSIFIIRFQNFVNLKINKSLKLTSNTFMSWGWDEKDNWILKFLLFSDIYKYWLLLKHNTSSCILVMLDTMGGPVTHHTCNLRTFSDPRHATCSHQHTCVRTRELFSPTHVFWITKHCRTTLCHVTALVRVLNTPPYHSNCSILHEEKTSIV